MQFLANENFPFPSLLLLREAGLEIISISESFPGIPDPEVIEKALAYKAIILTFDKDYGELIFKYQRQKPPSVVFFRFKGEHPKAAGEILLELLESKEFLFEDYFTVVERDSIRQRKY